jgi:hypothetical protein
VCVCVLLHVTQALTPLVEGIISKDMERFKDYALKYEQQAALQSKAA